MNPQDATDIIHSLTPEKRKEAFSLYNFLGENMKGGNWDELNPQQKMLLKFAFAIEYGRRTGNKTP